MINRRSFIQSAIVVAATPALATLFPLSTTARPSLGPEPSPQAADTTNPDRCVFKIDGWDHCEAKASDGNEVWIRIDQSWRTAWR